MIQDKKGVSGNVTLKIFDAVTDELLETQEQHNLVVAGGLLSLITTLFVPSSNAVRVHSVRFANTGQVAPLWSDTTVGSNQLVKPILPTTGASVAPTAVGGVSLNVNFELLAEEYNGNTFNDLSIWLKSDINDEYHLFSRIIRAPIAKTSAIRIEGIWTINFSVVTA